MKTAEEFYEKYNALHHTDDGTTNKYDITADKSAIIQLMKEYAAQQREVTEQMILDEILLEANRTQYNHDGSPIYMARLYGLKRAAKAIKELYKNK